jgi:hypothetical protein
MIMVEGETANTGAWARAECASAREMADARKTVFDIDLSAVKVISLN